MVHARHEVTFRLRGLALLFLVTSGLAACAPADLSTFATRPDAVEARDILDTLARGDVAAVAARLDASQLRPETDATLAAIAALFPKRAPTRVRLVGYEGQAVHKVGGPAAEIGNVTFESTYGDAHVLSNIVLRSVDGGARQILGLHAQALPGALEDVNGFSLGDMGFTQYGFLLAMIAVAATTVAALVSWFRRRRVLARRWWWLLAILVGAFKISVNWVTGAVAVQALTIQFFSLGAERGLIGPWILCFSIPAGAIAFLVNARRDDERLRQDPPAPTTIESPGAVSSAPTNNL